VSVTACLSIILFDHKILMLQRPEGYWCLPGGHIDEGESEVDCIKREVEEETGLKIDKFSGFFHNIRTHKHISIFYSFSDSNKVILSDEHISYKWVDIYDSDDIICQGPITKWVLEFLREKRHKPLYKVIIPDEPGGFGSNRFIDIHSGGDLYCEKDEYIYAIEEGEVISIQNFTGYEESPWWCDTQCVVVKTKYGHILYGEISPIIKIGDKVLPGTHIGTSLPVLRKFKNRPCVMLHLEFYSDFSEPVIWSKNEGRPVGLFDPSILIYLSSKKVTQFDISSYDGKFSNPYC
jgi:8-oxo-dGTP diphosphatase